MVAVVVVCYSLCVLFCFLFFLSFSLFFLLLRFFCCRALWANRSFAQYKLDRYFRYRHHYLHYHRNEVGDDDDGDNVHHHHYYYCYYYHYFSNIVCYCCCHHHQCYYHVARCRYPVSGRVVGQPPPDWWYGVPGVAASSRGWQARGRKPGT